MTNNRNSNYKKILSFAISLLIMLSLGIPAATSYAAVTTKSYNFKNMTKLSTWGTTYKVNQSAATFSFSGQYREIKFKLPDTLAMSQCSSVTFNASSPNGKIAFKLYDTSGNQAAVKYNFKSGTSNCTFAPNTSSSVSSIGIMSQETSRFSATVNSVTFTMNGSTSSENSTTGNTIAGTTTTGSSSTAKPATGTSTTGSSTTGTSTTGSTASPSAGTSASTAPTLLNTYGSLFGKSGTAVNYSQLNNASTLGAIKKEYNSVTLENEMKPDAILGSSANLMSASAAKSKGYYIPSGYTESTVPSLNFNTVDAVLKICYNNGLKLRGHCLVWHSQTPDWFFRTGYSASGAYVSQSVMNARMEMFIKSYMSHVHNSSYGNVVYAWDVVNEYLHATASGWSKIYGSNLGTKPGFVKNAFQYAYECLDSLEIKNSVSLFYNDYNTYMVTNDIVSLVNYINSGKKLCDGVGMQSHLATNYPTTAAYKSTMQTFLNAGFEVQVTELDVTNSSDAAQASYVYDLYSSILSLQKAGTKGKLTGITWWGLYDSVSWRSSQKPLLFSSLNSGKASYSKALQAYTDAGFTVGAVSAQSTGANANTTPTVTSVPASGSNTGYNTSSNSTSNTASNTASNMAANTTSNATANTGSNEASWFSWFSWPSWFPWSTSPTAGKNTTISASSATATPSATKTSSATITPSARITTVPSATATTTPGTISSNTSSTNTSTTSKSGKFHVFLLLGQSNMAGYPKAQASDKVEDPRVRVLGYDNNAALGRVKDQWDTACAPLHETYQGAIGPGDWFGKTLIEKVPNGDTIGLVPCAISGEKIETFMKSGGSKYDWIVNRAKIAQQSGGIIEGIIFHQGESNNGDTSWPGKVNTLVSDLKKDLNLGDIPFIAGELLYSGGCSGHNVQVNKLPSVVKNCSIVSAQGLVVDPSDTQWKLHFSHDSQVTLGKRYAAKMLEALGW